MSLPHAQNTFTTYSRTGCFCILTRMSAVPAAELPI